MAETLRGYLETFSSKTIEKAQALVDEGKVRPDDDYYHLWWVEGSQTYRVQLSDEAPWWATCTCPNGKRNAFGRAKCYHVAAAALTEENGAA